MRSVLSRSRGLGVLFAPFILACTTAATPTEVPKTEKAGAPPGQPIAEAAPDFSPVPAPASLFLVARASSPAASWRALNKLHPIPVDLDRELDELTQGASAFIDLNGSFDAAMGVDPATLDSDDPDFSFAASIPLKPMTTDVVEFLRKKGDTVESISPGRYRVKSGQSLRCELWDIPNLTPRLVCADDADAQKALGEWLARTLPTLEKPTEDLVITADFSVGRQKGVDRLNGVLEGWVKELEDDLGDEGISDPQLLRGVKSAATHSVALVSDLDKLSLGLRLDRDPSISAELSFRARSSWFTKVMTDGLKDAAPPDLFLRLPKDAEAAFWGRSADPKLFEDVRTFAKRGLGIALDAVQKEAKGFMDAKDREAFEKVLAALPTQSGAWSMAYGPTPQRASTLPANGKVTNAQRVTEAQRRFANGMGWFITGGDGSSSEVIGFLDAALEAEKRLVRIIKAEADQKLKEASPEMKPILKKQREEIDQEEPKISVTKDPAGYPKGSALYEIAIRFDSDDVDGIGGYDAPWIMESPVAMEAPMVAPPTSGKRPPAPPPRKPPPPPPVAKGSFSVFIVVVPAGEGKLAFGMSADKESLKKKLVAMQSGAESETLGSRAELALLKKPMAGGGFITLGQMLRRFAALDAEDNDAADLVHVLDQLPAKGESPIFLTVHGTPGDAPKIKWTATLDGRWIKDLTMLGVLAEKDGLEAPPQSTPSRP